MIVHLLTALQDENSGLIDAISVFTRTKGEDVTVKCSDSLSRSLKFICRQTCEENILIETTDVRARSGRYSLEWRKKGVLTGEVLVTIRQLTESDSGLYRCGSLHSSHEEFRVIVIDGEFLLSHEIVL